MREREARGVASIVEDLGVGVRVRVVGNEGRGSNVEDGRDQLSG